MDVAIVSFWHTVEDAEDQLIKVATNLRDLMQIVLEERRCLDGETRLGNECRRI